MLILQRLHRAVRLTRVIADAWLGLVAFDLAIMWGFAGIYASVRARHVKTHRTTSLSTADIVWAVDEACVWYVKRAACLQRSVVATCLLRRNGVPADLVIGYRPVPFESHAWVEVDGCVANDRPQYQRFFAVLERI